jgi:hypothetical protein
MPSWPHFKNHSWLFSPTQWVTQTHLLHIDTSITLVQYKLSSHLLKNDKLVSLHPSQINTITRLLSWLARMLIMCLFIPPESTQSPDYYHEWLCKSSWAYFKSINLAQKCYENSPVHIPSLSMEMREQSRLASHTFLEAITNTSWHESLFKGDLSSTKLKTKIETT